MYYRKADSGTYHDHLTIPVWEENYNRAGQLSGGLSGSKSIKEVLLQIDNETDTSHNQTQRAVKWSPVTGLAAFS